MQGCEHYFPWSLYTESICMCLCLWASRGDALLSWSSSGLSMCLETQNILVHLTVKKKKRKKWALRAQFLYGVWLLQLPRLAMCFFSSELWFYILPSFLRRFLPSFHSWPLFPPFLPNTRTGIRMLNADRSHNCSAKPLFRTASFCSTFKNVHSPTLPL